MKIARMLAMGLAALHCTLVIPSAAQEQREPYLSGGSVPFPEEVQAILDAHQPLLTLGINHDWMRASNIDPVPYANAIDHVARAVKAGRIPGAVIYADRVDSKTMPAGIGYFITDPQRRRVRFNTLYFVEDMTGPMVTVPIIHQMVLEERLSYDRKVGDILVPLAESPLGGVTLELVLRHASGLPTAWPEDLELAGRAEVIEALAALSLDPEPGRKVVKSPLNFLVLGLIAEEMEGRPFAEIAEERMSLLLGRTNASMGISAEERQFLAPGRYDERLGRMAWGEPADPAGIALHPNAGHTGLVVSADIAAGNAGYKLVIAATMLGPDGEELSPIARTLLPDPSIEGGEYMGLGYELNRHGEGSFGWDAEGGSSFWVLPDKQAVVVYLSNPDHPSGILPDFDDPRERAIPFLVESLKPLPAEDVDTAAEGEEAPTGSGAPE